ncbi:Replication termination factor 2 [Coemansia guatemalensis]|uniref:Replication termination factor 2 n=1 Tax=Coemansia guatemalensis TaxID=2761395 RepID=A0A9W8LQX3_9FUNG|nr:Replication termination factor 2 [Coemansia guatemalensis]
MGNDGGSIPRRNEMVREKKKDEKPDRTSKLVAMTFFCALSKQLLHEPVVGDGLGRLYNREAILEYLLDRSAFGDGSRICAHISSIKDVKTLNLKVNPEFDKSREYGDNKKVAASTLDDRPTAQFVCPITLKEMNGNMQFEFNWTCGCVLSTRARKEMPESSVCLVCGESFDPKDIVPINSLSTEVLDSLHKRIDERKASQKMKKKKSGKSKLKSNLDIKAKRKQDDDDDGSGTVVAASSAKVQRTSA